MSNGTIELTITNSNEVSDGEHASNQHWAACEHSRTGFELVALRGKEPYTKEWQANPFGTLAGVHAHWLVHPHDNPGILLGHQLRDLDGVLVDVDLDAPEALEFWDLLGPPTDAVFGRRGSPASHRLYRVDTIKSAAHKDPTLEKTDYDRSMIIEARGAGKQTMAPGSVYPKNREIVAWKQQGDPTFVDGTALTETVSSSPPWW